MCLMNSLPVKCTDMYHGFISDDQGMLGVTEYNEHMKRFCEKYRNMSDP